MKNLLRLMITGGCLAILPGAATAQLRSEKAKITQTIGNTTLSIEYYRPVARGRLGLFGKVVHWGETWTPGANWATTLETDNDVTLNGHKVPKGKYSVWMITREKQPWTFFLHSKARRYHTERPKDTTDVVVRFAVQPDTTLHMETLSWYFPVIGRNTATLYMHWGRTFVPLQVTVESARLSSLNQGAAATYAGEYSVEDNEGDVTEKYQVRVMEKDGVLRWAYEGDESATSYMALVPNGTHQFQIALFKNNELVELQTENAVVFRVASGNADGFEIRNADGKVTGRAKRVK